MTTIGVFDSGFGGLTVLREMLPLNGGANYIFLGDTARLPYGSKSRETIARYAVSSARFLAEQGAQSLVVACNTATAVALDDIKAALPIPVLGVIQPGARAALAASARAEAHVLVLATDATTQSKAYTRELNALGLRATEKACPLLVPLIEEGWTDHAVTAEVLRIYLLEALAEAKDASVLLLGCTHYPLIRPLIHTILQEIHHPMRVIDSAECTARALAAMLPPPEAQSAPRCAFYATDSIEKFQRLGGAFLGQPLDEVRLIDLGG